MYGSEGQLGLSGAAHDTWPKASACALVHFRQRQDTVIGTGPHFLSHPPRLKLVAMKTLLRREQVAQV